MEFEGIVIRRTPYKEGSAMITVLAKDKIRSFLAKGVLKISSKNASCVNLFTKSLFQTYHGAEGDWLRVGEIIQSFPNTYKDLEKLMILDFISEITNCLIGSQDAQNAFEYLDKTLSCLNDGFSTWTALIIYFAQVLKIAGYGLDVSRCAICGSKEEIVSLSYKVGGFICSKCYDRYHFKKTDSRKLKIIRYIFMVDIANFERVEFGKEESKEILFELCQFVNMTSQIEFKSLELIRNL